MNKLRLLLLGLLVVGIVFWLAGKVGGPPDPQYQGRRLSAILKTFPKNLYTLESGKQVRFKAEDVQTIRHMGTNAIPYLLKEMSATDSALKRKLRDLVSRQSVILISFIRVGDRQYRASHVFEVLGPVAEPAIPELAKLLGQPGEPGGYAVSALQSIGDKSIPILIQALSHTNAIVRASAARALGSIPSGGSVAVPALVHSLDDLDWWVKRCAALALGDLHQEAGFVVPALMKYLEDPDNGVRQNSIVALLGFGAAAKAAIPALLKARETSDADTRHAIDQATKHIDPEAAARAGIR